MDSMTRGLPVFWRVLHWVIIVNFVVQVLYGGYMVFFKVTAGSWGPLFGAAADMPFEKMMARRLYASETWIAISGLSVYVAITEMLPRILRELRAGRA